MEILLDCSFSSFTMVLSCTK